MSSPIEEIKNRLDIVEVIGSYIKLKKTGANYKALCPFHSEKNPSFFVSPARQIWHCFGCQRGGDVFKFVMQIEGIEFGDALRILAQKAGVQLKPISKELRTERSRIYEICELATKFFEKQLEGSSKGKMAKEYLLNRGINEDSIKKWRIGWAPETWRGLCDFLISRKYKIEEIEKSGLLIKTESGSYYDRFRGRIIFPIFDLNSQVIGFGGRVFQKEEKVAKYINTPNTILYDKSKILYGLDKARLEIRKRNFSILVEGYTDVILAHQIGMENTISTSGTALTPYQLSLLKRYTENLFLAFDMDIAGDSARKRGIDLAQIQGFNLKIVELPKDQDPADVISKNSEDFKKSIEMAKSILDFYFENTFSNFDKNTPEGKKEISKILLPFIKRIQNKIEQTFWTQKLAKELNVKEEDIVSELGKLKLEEEIYGLEPEEMVFAPKKTRKELLEERFLTLILKKPDYLKKIEEDKISFFSEKSKEILKNLRENFNFPLEKLNPETREFFNYLSLKSEIEEIKEEEIFPEIQICLKEIQSLDIKEKLNLLSEEIKKAEGEKDFEKIKNLTQKYNQLIKTING